MQHHPKLHHLLSAPFTRPIVLVISCTPRPSTKNAPLPGAATVHGPTTTQRRQSIGTHGASRRHRLLPQRLKPCQIHSRRILAALKHIAKVRHVPVKLPRAALGAAPAYVGACRGKGRVGRHLAQGCAGCDAIGAGAGGGLRRGGGEEARVLVGGALVVRGRVDWGVVEGIVLATTWLGLAGAFDAEEGHLVHELGGELVVALETEELVLEVGLVEEDDVERYRVHLVDGADFGDDTGEVVALVIEDEFEHAGFQLFDDAGWCTEAEDEFDWVGETAGPALVEDEERVEQRIGSLDD